METIKESNFEDEYFSEHCYYCGWRYEFAESHILFCGGGRCKYILSLFDSTYDENGELIFTKKDIIKQITEKKK